MVGSDRPVRYRPSPCEVIVTGYDPVSLVPMPLPPTFPDLASLDLFVTVVELGSVSKAAARHGMAQPSASARIQQLERQLGVALLDRSPTGSTPTDTGRLVAEWTAAILEAAHDLRVGLDALEAAEAGRLRIAASYTIAEYLLPGWLARFRNRHAESVELAVENSTGVLDAVRSGRVDVGFVESPGAVDDLVTQVVDHDELVVVVTAPHPWAGRSSIEVDALLASPLIVREPGSGTRQHLDRALADAGCPPITPAFELGSTAAIKNAVRTGHLPGVLSRVAVSSAADLEAFALLSVDGVDLRRDLRSVRRPGAEPARVRDLVEIATRVGS